MITSYVRGGKYSLSIRHKRRVMAASGWLLSNFLFFKRQNFNFQTWSRRKFWRAGYHCACFNHEHLVAARPRGRSTKN